MKTQQANDATAGARAGARVRNAIVAITLVVVGLSCYYYEKRVVAVGTESIGYRLAWVVGGWGSKGDYVNFTITNEFIHGGRPVTLTKQIVCAPGEDLELVGDHHECNGVVLGTLLDRASSGHRLLPFVWHGGVPAGKVFVEGSHPRSFDSRYFGFVDQSQTNIVKPLL